MPLIYLMSLRTFFLWHDTQEELAWLGRRLNAADTNSAPIVPDFDDLFDSGDEPSEILPQAYEV